MKILFNIFLIIIFLTIMVPVFRRFLFHLLVGRQLVKEQKKNSKEKAGPVKSGIHVDYVPPEAGDKRFRSGGEYVDYEEVKD